jgi:D-xylonolactonase
VKAIADYGNLCGECPVWDPESKVVRWVDNSDSKFYEYEPASGIHRLANEGVQINGFRPNRAGGFVITNNAGIWLWNGASDTRLICDSIGGEPCPVNDCVADAAGRLITGSLFYDPARSYRLGNLLRVDNDGEVEILDEGFHISNGLAFSPDGSILYFADSAARTIYAYDYRLERGLVSNCRVFVQVPGDEGLPDGLSVDADGFVWSAQWYGSCIVRYDPDGRVERRIAIPAKQTSSLTFGGADLTDIFITSAGLSEPMPIMPPGYDPDSGCIGGALYHVNLGIQGKPEAQASIALPA